MIEKKMNGGRFKYEQQKKEFTTITGKRKSVRSVRNKGKVK